MNMLHVESSKQPTHSSDASESKLNDHFLRPIIDGLVRAVLRNSLGVDYSFDNAILKQASFYTMRKIFGMPEFLRFPMIILTVVFDLCGLLIAGKMFRYLSSEEQLRHFKLWQKSVVSPCRDLTSFYQKIGIFIYFSLVELKAEDV